MNNLVTDSWIYVLDKKQNKQKVSLKDIFEHGSDYLCLNNDTAMQDLVILRMLIAIKISSDNHGNTLDYLKRHQNDFNLTGEKPFNSLPVELYDKLVSKKTSSHRGVILQKQINRQVSESANSPNVTASYDFSKINKLKDDELVRWLLVYQQFSGSADKNKLAVDLNNKKLKYKAFSGWLEKTSCFVINGDNLKETIELNTPKNLTGKQIPVWEYDQTEYLQKRLHNDVPENTAELLTYPSRAFTLVNNDNDVIIYGATLPNVDVFKTSKLEFMSLKKFDKKQDAYKVRSFNQYDLILEDQSWRKFNELLDENTGIANRNSLTSHYVTSLGYINDGNASSQLPFKEIDNSFYVAENQTLQKQVINDLVALGDALYDSTLKTKLKDDFFRQINFTVLNTFSVLDKDTESINDLYNTATLLALRLGKQKPNRQYNALFVKDIYEIVKGKVNDELFNPYSY